MRPSLSSAVLSLLICLSLLAVSVSPYEVESHNKLRRRSFTTDAQPECKWPPEYAYAFTSLGNFLQWTTQFIEATFYRAYLDTTMPYSVFGIPLGLEIPQKKYRMSLCRRENVANCLYYGNSSNGLPERLQGLFWLNGINIPEEITSTAGKWDPVLRMLSICPGCVSTWAYSGNSSEPAPTCPAIWLSSGAAHANLFTWWNFYIDIYYNRGEGLGAQDITFGQLVGGINLYGIKIPAPLFILNWTQELQPDGLSWRRRSSALLQNTSGGDYFWRKIVDGHGKPTRYWDGWLADYGGRPFSYFSSAT